MPFMRQTKILATLGPATAKPDKIEALYKAGANVFRLNFSHGTHADHEKAVGYIRALEREVGKPIGILGDLQGPKLRIGELKDGVIKLEQGQAIRFDLDKSPGDEKRVPLPHPEVISVLKKDSLIFFDDGKVRARITDKGDDYVEAVIRTGAELSNRKGLNIPNEVIPVPALTDKDRSDLQAALDMGVDWIALSFVQKPEDLEEARALIQERAALMAKIEKPSALAHIESIIAASDGIMVARGDLGVEIPPEQVPATQKNIIRQARQAGKTVVVATQMLESMIENARPTRAEASDVATAVYDGTDAVMLSAETATGSYPEQAVQIMAKICAFTEQDEGYRALVEMGEPVYEEPEEADPSDAITTAAYYVAQDVGAGAIVTYTQSGSTARRMVRYRPAVQILCLTPNEKVARRLCLSYGVRPIHDTETIEDFTGPAQHAADILVEQGLAEKGERFVMTAGVPFGVSGTTNILRIAEID